MLVAEKSVINQSRNLAGFGRLAVDRYINKAFGNVIYPEFGKTKTPKVQKIKTKESPKIKPVKVAKIKAVKEQKQQKTKEPKIKTTKVAKIKPKKGSVPSIISSDTSSLIASPTTSALMPYSPQQPLTEAQLSDPLSMYKELMAQINALPKVSGDLPPDIAQQELTERMNGLRQIIADGANKRTQIQDYLLTAPYVSAQQAADAKLAIQKIQEIEAASREQIQLDTQRIPLEAAKEVELIKKQQAESLASMQKEAAERKARAKMEKKLLKPEEKLKIAQLKAEKKRLPLESEVAELRSKYEPIISEGGAYPSGTGDSILTPNTVNNNGAIAPYTQQNYPTMNDEYDPYYSDYQDEYNIPVVGISDIQGQGLMTYVKPPEGVDTEMVQSMQEDYSPSYLMEDESGVVSRGGEYIQYYDEKEMPERYTESVYQSDRRGFEDEYIPESYSMVGSSLRERIAYDKNSGMFDENPQFDMLNDDSNFIVSENVEFDENINYVDSEETFRRSGLTDSIFEEGGLSFEGVGDNAMEALRKYWPYAAIGLGLFAITYFMRKRLAE